MFVIIRPLVFGIDISNIFLIYFLFRRRSFFVRANLFGKKINKMIKDIVSLIIFTNIKPHTALLTLFLISLGINILISVIRVICSIMLEITCGSICCFPKKYALIILDILINGNVRLIAIIGNIHLSSCNKFKDIYLDVIINIIIVIKFMIIEIGIVLINIFLLLYLSSETNFDIAMGILKLVIVMASEKVGRINIYKLTPSKPIVLVIIIFINNPNILVMKPPIIRIIVDLINLSFIIYIYVFRYKKRRENSSLFLYLLIIRKIQQFQLEMIKSLLLEKI